MSSIELRFPNFADTILDHTMYTSYLVPSNTGASAAYHKAWRGLAGVSLGKCTYPVSKPRGMESYYQAK